MIAKFYKTIVKTFVLLTVFVLAFNYFSTSTLKRSVEIKTKFSAKVLKSNISINSANVENISEGYLRESNEIIVDHNNLVKDFFYVMDSQFNNFDRESISALLLVYFDKYYVYDPVLGQWLPPFFFTISSNGNLFYVNTQDEQIYRYDSSGNKLYFTIADIGLSSEDKDSLIIDKINDSILKFTSKDNLGNSFGVKIRNPNETDPDEIFKYQYFNVLDNVTFFVVYKENKTFGILGKNHIYNTHVITGYTIN